jgi:hypothetical protein
MFRDSSNGIEEYTTSVNRSINKCVDDVVASDRTSISQTEAMDYRQHLHRAKEHPDRLPYQAVMQLLGI